MKRRRMVRAGRSGVLAPILGPATRLSIARYNVIWPELSAPLRIVALSDLHFGWARSNAAFADRVRRRVNGLSPDLTVFLGDIAGGVPGSDRANRVTAGAKALSDYNAPLGCFAVLGNHEWKDDADAQARKSGPNRAVPLLEAAGWQVLQNNALRLPILGTDFWLAGLDSQHAFPFWERSKLHHIGADDIASALAEVPADQPVLLLAHEPDIFEDLPDQVRLTLSGHTHAGQFQLRGKSLSRPGHPRRRYTYGRYQIGPRNLIISAGLGCSILPFRLGVVPEIVVVDLVPGDA